MDSLQLDAEDVVFIDDHLANLEGAARLGITPILIATKQKSDLQTDYTKINHISALVRG